MRGSGVFLPLFSLAIETLFSMNREKALCGAEFSDIQLWRDDSISGASDTFVLGNYCDTLVGGFGGAYDMWRVSKGFVATENLIWSPPGMIIVFR